MPKPCPVCGFELAATIEAGLSRCPECSFRFTERDLQNLFGEPDPEGVPRSLSPHDLRFSGKWVIAALALVVLVFVVAIVIALMNRS